jgi:hypothetical protein
MSEAAPPIDADAALARLAQMELAWAERVHAQAMAATDNDEINAIGRTFGRAGRALRQTLLLKARLAERAAEAARRAEPSPPPRLGRLHPPKVGDRAQDLFEAVGRIACAMYSDAPEGEDPERDAVLAAQERLVSLEVERPDFLERSLEDHVRAHCEQLDLPVEFAHCWRGLPPAPWSDACDYVSDPDPDDEAAVPFPDEPLTREELHELLKRAKPRRRNTS